MPWRRPGRWWSRCSAMLSRCVATSREPGGRNRPATSWQDMAAGATLTQGRPGDLARTTGTGPIGGSVLPPPADHRLTPATVIHVDATAPTAAGNAHRR